MGKGTDKLYITHSEWSNEFGGMSFGGAKTRRSEQTTVKVLPFDCCALSLTKFELPYCTNDGMIFDLGNILPYMKQHGTNPITGEKLEAKDLFKLEFHKNNEGKFCDPVTFKIFNEYTKLCAIRNSGQVYHYDTIEQFNLKSNNLRDLVTDLPFTKKDIIIIQDPNDLSKRDLSKIGNVNKVKKVESIGINLKGSSKRILNAAVQKVANPMPTSATAIVKPTTNTVVTSSNKANHSLGLTSASFTSMGMTPVTQNQSAILTNEQLMFPYIKSTGYIQIKTNLGDLNFELFCNKAPKACYNFIKLSEQNYYDGVSFHRSIRHFMLQGGDPTNTGKGGKSYWNTPFEDEVKNNLSHSKRGVLAMANKGKNTNTSQFYITYRSCPHLDGKHTIFGQLVGGEKILDLIEQIQTDRKNDRPIEPITIESISIFKDPFKDYLKDIEIKNTEKEQKELKLKEKIEEDKKTIFGNSLKEVNPIKRSNDKDIKSIGKYLKLNQPPIEDDQNQLEEVLSKPSQSKAKKNTGGFGDFSSW